MSNNKKSVNLGLPALLTGILSIDKRYHGGFYNRGIFGDNILEAVPKYIKSPSEQVINKGNSSIVLGRDRPASRASGYGGQGHTQASSIDMVVGRGGPSVDSELNYDPNFASDGARIYISQKTDIDTNFNLAAGEQGSSTARSGIGIKADAVRIIGRDGIKFITRTENKNSKDGSASYNGIELIACNDESDIQSLIKGENLVEALSELEKRIAELSSIVLNHLKDQMQFNMKLMSHNHIVPQIPAGATTSAPSISLIPAGINVATDAMEGMLDNFKHRMNIGITWKTKYLNSASNKYICSKYNKVN
tara:strand:- start:724 stop:1641 length:918 start_codon:yes stop_codon:yes gene_type:complete